MNNNSKTKTTKRAKVGWPTDPFHFWIIYTIAVFVSLSAAVGATWTVVQVLKALGLL